MVDESAPRVRADDQPGHAQPIAVLVDRWRHDVVVPATPVIPRHEDRGRRPGSALHDAVDDLGDVRLAVAEKARCMLALPPGRHDPGHRGKLVGGEVVVERLESLDVADLTVLLNRLKEGERVPDLRRPGVLCQRHARQVAIGAVGLHAIFDVVLPADLCAVQQIGQIGPRVVGGGVARQHRVLPVGQVESVGARHRIAAGAGCRPLRDEEQVRRQAPGSVRLEHVVLQDEILRVAPVVGDLSRVVIAHDVAAVPRRAVRVHVAVAGNLRGLSCSHEAVHLSAVDVGARGRGSVRRVGVQVFRVVERSDAGPSRGVG